MSKNLFFEGTVCPMITPIREDFTLDTPSTKRLIDHLIEGEIDGIFILGTTGEASSLSLETKQELIRLSAERLDGTEIPLLVGIGDTSFEQSVALCTYAKQCGANAVVALAPYYFDLNEDEILDYFLNLADHCSLPLFLYNYPKSTHFNLPPKVICILIKHPNIIGCKDSSGDPNYLKVLAELAQKKESNFLIGTEELMSEWMQKGFHGGVLGGSNLFPKLFKALSESLKQKDLDKINTYHQIVMKISKDIYALEGGSYSYLKGMKAAAASMGLCENKLVPPLKAGDENFYKTIEQKTLEIQKELDALL